MIFKKSSDQNSKILFEFSFGTKCTGTLNKQHLGF